MTSVPDYSTLSRRRARFGVINEIAFKSLAHDDLLGVDASR
jgi:hypothetical protein